MSLVDANVVLRYLLDDHAELSPQAAKILEHEQVSLPIEVACEVVYVLQKVYAVEREVIAQQLTALITDAVVQMEKPRVFLRALECYSQSRLDFVDCLLWGRHVEDGQQVFTFDKKLEKLMRED
ncbi:MAG: PIN domain-containing protein [Gammaproteobacteria bacterium]|nr:PIN domain-containing protein [Gammaproteobacteria bacterium]